MKLPSKSCPKLSHRTKNAYLYGFEQSDGVQFLVMELAEGETLAERLRRGPIPVEDALPIFKQIAEALEAAHEKGIIHRDLKPANIKVTPEGKAKILDFGLAKAFAEEIPTSDLSQSPTITREGTQAGVILGTAAYMSPEQARGKALDKRTDIWAFGCVFYEALASQNAFQGGTLTDTLAAIVNREPDWEALPAATPWRIRELLRRCLQKDRRRRLRDIGDGWSEIDDALAEPSQAVASPAASATHEKRGGYWIVATALVSLSAVAVAFIHFTELRPEPNAIRFSVSSPPEAAMVRSFAPVQAISPDGSRLAFKAAGASGQPHIWMRSLDSLIAVRLPATEGVSRFFWSPDSRSIGFFADGKLKKIDVSGGPPQTLCDATDGPGAAWNREGVILFAPQFGGSLQQVSEAGGEPAPVTTLDAARQEDSHLWPHFLPDGKHFLYLSRSVVRQEKFVFVGSLDSKIRKSILPADYVVGYAPPGYLLFVRERTLIAQPFDADALELSGEEHVVVEKVGYEGDWAWASVSVSNNGVLAFATGTTKDFQLVWRDRQGQTLGSIGPPGPYHAISLSPDEKRVAVELLDPETGAWDIWVVELERAVTARLTFDPNGDRSPLWSPDGSRISFVSDREGGVYHLYEKSSSGAREPQAILTSGTDKVSLDWSKDDRFIVFGDSTPSTKADVWVLPLFEERKPFPFLRTEFNEMHGQLSPDGRWMAYVSDESGAPEVYVQSFLVSENKWRVSTNGGGQPRWRDDGKELFYISADRKLMVIEVDTESSEFTPGLPQPLFTISSQELALAGFSGHQWDLAANGQRFLFGASVQGQAPPSITVVLNWTSELNP